jgi:hypothetical protein
VSDSLTYDRWLDTELSSDRDVGAALPQERRELGLGQAQTVHRGHIEVPYSCVKSGVKGQPPSTPLREPEQASASKTDCGSRDSRSD